MHDSSHGIFVVLPEVLFFIIFAVLIEGIVVTRWVKSKWFDLYIYRVTFLSNLVSGLLGIFLAVIVNKSWFLVIWFPWVFISGTDSDTDLSLNTIFTFYGVAFLLALLIETIINQLLLKKYAGNKVIKGTLVANILSFTVGFAVLYFKGK